MIPQKSRTQARLHLCLALHNIRSCHNVGSIFRTADAAGVSKIFICGETPAPIDRFGRHRKDISKVSLGAEKSVEWEYIQHIKDLIKNLKKEKYKIYALEQDPRAVDYRKAGVEKMSGNKGRNKNLLILGNEVEGIPAEILERCNEIFEIPMRGKKESLNVAVAAGIALFSFL